jgi:2-methylcitrate dehydratase
MRAGMDKYERQLVNYIADLSFQDLSEAAIESTKDRLLDSLACAMAAHNSAPVEAMRNLALQSSSVCGATVFGTMHSAPVSDATLVLGTAVRAHDWNDTYLSKEPAHPSDNICAAMAVAEAENKTGRDLITGIVLAYELQCRLCDAAAIRKRGWDHVTYASISSTAAAAKLMALTPEQIRHALAIAITTGNYLRQTRIGTISNWKAAAFAKAAKNAVEAALYAKQGVSGPSEIIAGQHGFIHQITGDEFDLARHFGGQAGEEFKIVQTYIKYFPSEYHAQSAIWAAIEMREQIGADGWQNIQSIIVETSLHSYEIIGMERDKWQPRTKETADHSLPYMTAAALMDGTLTLKQFDEAHLHNKALLDLVQRVECKEVREYTDMYGSSYPNRVTLTMNNGRVFEKEVINPKGHPLNPLSRGEIETKFLKNSDGLLSRSQQDRLIRYVWDLENLGSIKQLMDSVAVL